MINLLLAAALAAPATAAPAQMPHFLVGCWEQQDGQSWTQECWTDPRAGQMMGSGRSGAGEVLKSWEWMRIVRGPDGTLTFLASPGGVAATPFAARSLSPTSVEFVNAGHHYPQRVRYELRNGRVEAEISLIDGSKPTRWSYRRSASPASKD